MLKRILSISVLALLTFGSVVPAYAQESVSTYQVYRLPRGSMLGEGDSRKICYTFTQYKDLLHLDSDLKMLDTSLPPLREALMEIKVANKELRLAIAVSETQLRVMSEDRARLSKQWEAENLARHKAENKPMFGSWIPWALSGVLGAAVVGIVVGIVAGNK